MSDHSADAVSEQEEVLDGGNMGGATRVGATVRRGGGAWSPTVQRLLGHLRERGLTWSPQPLGTDEHGRDTVSYLPGVVPQYPLPDWIWSQSVLTDAGVHLAQLHEASASFDTTDAVWQFPARQPAEVICHNDFAPYNMVFTDRRLTGVIDWDTASPGPRSWDLAYLAYRLVPLADPDNRDAVNGDLDERARRLRMLCDAYGSGLEPAHILQVAIHRLHDLAAFTKARADQGQENIRSHVGLYQRDAAWITAHAEHLSRDVQG
ncbi:Ser/Thr protein kinase RdoA (MazF antagonist) [Micromonospora luteifusca]|uniref:Ser/Thr protein kinase RdoA (MazF antagonist) n=1 Tax=Micromonospora luteifusca TaxID=709860 RepID=A0ABS2M467_9ACTN|nr:aminoglycoside phosphotransferase family protein [Micromonospora luteifusca]MBM7495094.1 Ser/Thr protein kinase RdoA (MazF antagonist) [Micromonospora luteifusca]